MAPLGNGNPAEDDADAGPAVVVDVTPLNGQGRISSRRGDRQRAPPTDETDTTTMGEHMRTHFRDYFLGTCLPVCCVVYGGSRRVAKCGSHARDEHKRTRREIDAGQVYASPGRAFQSDLPASIPTCLS